METNKIKNYESNRNKEKNVFLILSVLFLLFNFINIFMYINTEQVSALSSSSTNIDISIKESNVVNLIYKVFDQNKNLIKDKVRFDLIDRKTNKIIATKEIEYVHSDNYDGPLLIFENVPLGSYVISPNNNRTYEGSDLEYTKYVDLKVNMFVDTDKNYIDKQHVFKDYVVFVKNESNYRETNIDQKDYGDGHAEFINDANKGSNNVDKIELNEKKVKTGDDTSTKLFLTGVILPIIFLIILLIYPNRLNNKNDTKRNGVNNDE